jgi:putative glutathione S-transferase
MTDSTFTLGREQAAGGRFVRQDSEFRDRVSEPEAGRYHLYVCCACPWAHRTAIARKLKGLEEVISMSAVDPFRDARGWAFTGGEYADPLDDRRFLSEAYLATDPDFDGRVSVPVLWDKRTNRIVNNESGDVLRILNEDFAELADPAAPDLYPAAFREEIDRLNERVYDTVNNGVYKAGFTTDQAVHETEVLALFATLDVLEELLTHRRCLAGTPEPSEADWRLFTTLVRFDSVYALHFKCNVRRIVDYPNLWGYLRDLYGRPGIAETVRMDEIKRHYYTTHPSINPTGLIPIGPALDFKLPHGREPQSASRSGTGAL